MPGQTPADKRGLPPGIVHLAEFEHYAAYLSMAISERVTVFKVPKGTDTDFAKKYKITRDTLWKWKQRPELWALRDKHLMALKQYTGPILAALARKAMTRGDAFEVQTWLQIVEGYVPKQKKQVEVEGLADLIRQEIEADEAGDGEQPADGGAHADS